MKKAHDIYKAEMAKAKPQRHNLSMSTIDKKIRDFVDDVLEEVPFWDMATLNRLHHSHGGKGHELSDDLKDYLREIAMIQFRNLDDVIEEMRDVFRDIAKDDETIKKEVHNYLKSRKLI
jgi:hypothetical protein